MKLDGEDDLHRLVKRDADEGGESFGEKVKHVGEVVKDEFNKDVNKVAEVTHMKPWMVLVIVAVIAVVILGLIGWCIYRFFKKKRPKGKEEKGKEDDENALVDNEEAQVEEVRFYNTMLSFCCRSPFNM